ncbi:MAG: AAA family ATPase [Acidiferrobacterales bacterium]
MLVVNLFGAPGSGKSTVAAGVFHMLKQQGYIVEYAQEYAKELVWEERGELLEDQLHIMAQQNRRLMRVKDRVDIVVTDSPLLFSVVYAPAGYPQSFARFAFDLFATYRNLNFFLHRAVPYENAGRVHTAEESAVLGQSMLALLRKNAIDFEELDGDNGAVQKIAAAATAAAIRPRRCAKST